MIKDNGVVQFIAGQPHCWFLGVSFFESNLLQAYANGYTFEEIAKKIGYRNSDEVALLIKVCKEKIKHLL